MGKSKWSHCHSAYIRTYIHTYIHILAILLCVREYLECCCCSHHSRSLHTERSLNSFSNAAGFTMNQQESTEPEAFDSKSFLLIPGRLVDPGLNLPMSSHKRICSQRVTFLFFFFFFFRHRVTFSLTVIHTYKLAFFFSYSNCSEELYVRYIHISTISQSVSQSTCMMYVYECMFGHRMKTEFWKGHKLWQHFVLL